MPRKTDPKLDAYKTEFMKKNYDTMTIYVPRGKRELIRAFAAERGESANAFINRLIEEAMKKGEKE